MSDENPRDPDMTRLDGDDGRTDDATTLDSPNGRATDAEVDATMLDPGTSGSPADATTLDAATGNDGGTGGHMLVNLPSALRSEYRLLREIPTQGAEADIVIAENRSTGRQVAVKVYRFQRRPPAADVLERIDSADRAHVVEIIGRGMSDGRWYELLEYCSLGSLKDLIDGEGPKLSPERVREILDEVVPALGHIHAEPRHITHRDLKPANILVRQLEPTLDLVLTDFGLSRHLGNESLIFAATASRTVLYAAPEAAFGRTSPALDWWALGIVVIEMLTGRHPLTLPGWAEGPDEQVVSSLIATDDVPIDGVDDERWRDLCAGLTTRSPQHRWGFREVTEWMEGGRPRVTRTAPAQPAANVSPVTFPALDGDEPTQYRDAVRLAGAMGRHWNEALGVVANDAAHRREHRQLSDFLRTAGLQDALEILDTGAGTPTDRLLRLRLAMDPGAEPLFEGVDLAEGGLEQLAANGASGDARGAEVAAGILEHGVLTLYDNGSDARAGWAALEARWAQNWRWMQDQLQSNSTRLGGARDIDAVQRNRMCAQILHLLLNEEARQRVAGAGDVVRADREVADVAWFQSVVQVSGTAPRPAQDVVVQLLHGAAVEEVAAERERRARERREARQRARAALGDAFRASLLGMIGWAILGGLTAYVMTIAGPLWTSNGTASLFGIAAQSLWPFLLAAFVIGVVAEVTFNIIQVAQGTGRGFARPIPPWHAWMVVLAFATAVAAPAIAAGSLRAVAGTAIGWALCAAAGTHLICLVARGVLPQAAPSGTPPAVQAHSGVTLVAGVVAVIITAGIAWFGSSQAKSAEHRDFAERSRLLAQEITGAEWRCQPAAKPSPRVTAWMTLRVRCVHGTTSAIVSDYRTQRIADAEFDDLTGADRRNWLGQSCPKGGFMGTWHRGTDSSNTLGKLACWRSQSVAFVVQSSVARRRVVMMQRPGKLPWLYNWWRQQSMVFETAGAD